MIYPEHEKLAKVVVRSHSIGEFLDWLNSQGIILAEWQNEHLWPTQLKRGYNGLLARYFDIDLDVLDAEKEAMLEAMRQVQQ